MARVCDGLCADTASVALICNATARAIVLRVSPWTEWYHGGIIAAWP